MRRFGRTFGPGIKRSRPARRQKPFRSAAPRTEQSMRKAAAACCCLPIEGFGSGRVSTLRNIPDTDRPPAKPCAGILPDKTITSKGGHGMDFESARGLLEELLPFWRELTEEEQEKLAAGVGTKCFEAGQPIHRGREDCTGLFLVYSGQVRVFITSDSGKEITLYRLFERDICLFSASCMLRNITFDINIEAEKPTCALLLPTALYERLSRADPSVADFTSQLMAARFSDVMWTMDQVLFSSFVQRLATFLLEQAGIDGGETVLMTHETMARHLGSAREVVTRMLRYFQQEGMVELFRGGVRLVDLDRLERLSRF